MNPVPNRDFMEVHPLHQHQPHCKQQCFVFTEIADIELPAEITKFGGGNEKLRCSNGGIPAYNCKKDSCSESSGERPGRSRGRRILIGVCLVLVCIAMAGGIPLALQLRSSSLLEARLAFIRRLLTESPLIEGSWKPPSEIKLNSSGMADIRQNHIGAVLWPIAVHCGAQYLDAVQLALEGIDEARRITAATNTMHIVESADEMEQIHIRGEVAILMGIGGGHALGTSLAVLRSIYLLGARFVSLTSLECTTPWAAAAIRRRDYLIEENVTNSLNEFGKTMLYEMNRLGMLVEISQLSETAMVIALHTAKAPVLLMNAAPLSLCNNGTNVASIPDHVLSLLPENGGVILLNLERCGERPISVREAILAINYVRKVAGVDHIGLGGAPKSYALLLAELARDRVWGNAAIKKLVGGNVIRILREIEALKNRLPLYEEWIPHESIESNSYCRYPES